MPSDDVMEYSKELRFWIDALLHPGKATKRELKVKDALVLYYRLAAIPLVLGLIVAYFAGGFNPLRPFSASHDPLVGMGWALLLFLVIQPINILINGGIYHLLMGKLFKLYKKDISKPVAAMLYGVLPVLLVYWLYPLHWVGLVLMGVFGIWGIIVEIIALSNQLAMSRLKALGTIVLELVIVGVVVFVVAFAVAMWLMGGALPALLSSTCIAGSGYRCSMPTMGSDGKLSLSAGQDTGMTLSTVMLACSASAPTLYEFVPVTSLGLPGRDMVSGSTYSIRGLQCYDESGSAFSGGAGAKYYGELWINYTTSQSTSPARASLGVLIVNVSS